MNDTSADGFSMAGLSVGEMGLQGRLGSNSEGDIGGFGLLAKGTNHQRIFRLLSDITGSLFQSNNLGKSLRDADRDAEWEAGGRVKTGVEISLVHLVDIF